MPADVHVLGPNHETLCGEVRPVDPLLYAYSLEGAKGLQHHRAIVCPFCETAALGTDVQAEARKRGE